MAARRKYVRQKSLASDRPRSFTSRPSLSSKVTRTIIRRHHNLQKEKTKALKDGDDAVITRIEKEILANGGIETYQQASLLGQKNERGGDSSKILMEWLKPAISPLKARNGVIPMRLLEVGALSVDNACSQSGLFDIERIDLNSQAHGILQQDFMERPLPNGTREKFDMISLSLVLNYVTDPIQRGQMLRRTIEFLRSSSTEEKERQSIKALFPSLFLVLPAPCVTNSRYLDESRLQELMGAIGYEMVKQKQSNKLVYYLWRMRERAHSSDQRTFKKVEIRSGSARNNFAIVLK